MKKVQINTVLLLTACCLTLLAGCSSAQMTSSSSVEGTHVQSVDSAPKIVSTADIATPEKGPEIVIQSPMTLSNTQFTFNGQTACMRLKMVKGRYYEDWNPGAYMGTNWEGQFVIDLADEFGNDISETDISKMYTEPLTFNSSFQFEFDDYNNDGDPDFTLGQYFSSNVYVYRIFTLRKDGKIEELPVKDCSGLFGSYRTSNYSSELDKTDATTFEIKYYDNSVPAAFENFYQWDGAEFVLAKSRKMTQENLSAESLKDRNSESAGAGPEKTAGIKDNIMQENLIDTDYIRALRTADEFLYLWMYRNWPDGLKLVSDPLKKEKGEEELKSAICGISNPHHMSFEVLGAGKIDKDTYQFNVWLYEDITGDNSNVSCERGSPVSIVVKRNKSSNGEEQWMIDKF